MQNEANFIQIHMLTAYPASCLNRDELGRPKTAMLGGVNRLRISSQCLKRSWRRSEAFQTAIGSERLGLRTREIGLRLVLEPLRAAGVDVAQAHAAAKRVQAIFTEKPGKGAEAEADGADASSKKKKGKKEAAAAEAALSPVSQEIEPEGPLVFLSAREQAQIAALVHRMASGKVPSEADYEALLEGAGHGSVDLALFGRMMAARPQHNVCAAAQVAHAITVGGAEIEEDYFTAVDDLVAKDSTRHSGSAFLGEAHFGSGVFYHYVCVDRRTLLENLDGDQALARVGLRGLVHAMATVAPAGKISSHAQHNRAAYVLVELGDAQPRQLSLAFERPITGRGHLQPAIEALEHLVEAMDRVYGPAAEHRAALSVQAPSRHASERGGSLDQLLAFVDGR